MLGMLCLALWPWSIYHHLTRFCQLQVNAGSYLENISLHCFLQVFAVDWSPDGERVASGGKDKVLKV